jgi:hypothetical protein
MPKREIELVLPKRGLVARAILHENEAPRVCQMLWDRLPLEAETIHATFSGCELYVVFPWIGPPPPKENFTICTDAGDVFFYYAPWYADGAQPSGEVAIYYAREAVPMGGNGVMAGTLVASITDNQAGFADACETIWREGAETLLLRRAEGTG